MNFPPLTDFATIPKIIQDSARKQLLFLVRLLLDLSTALPSIESGEK